METLKKEERIEETLERLVDAHGLTSVVEWLAEVCDLKAQHIRENWQDEGLAKAWDREAWSLKKVKPVVS